MTLRNSMGTGPSVKNEDQIRLRLVDCPRNTPIGASHLFCFVCSAGFVLFFFFFSSISMSVCYLLYRVAYVLLFFIHNACCPVEKSLGIFFNHFQMMDVDDEQGGNTTVSQSSSELKVPSGKTSIRWL